MSDLDAAAIIAEHESDDPEMDYSECVYCYREWPCLPYRLAAELVAMRDREADAWARGEASGWSRAMRYMSDEPNVQRAENPYRAALAGEPKPQPDLDETHDALNPARERSQP